MSTDPYQHHTHNISEDTYLREQCGKTICKNKTRCDDDVTKNASLARTLLPPSQQAKNSDDDATKDDSSTILPLPLPPGEIHLSLGQTQVPTIQGTPQIASAPYTQGTPHLQKSRTETASASPSTHKATDPSEAQKARQQNHHPESNEQPSLPLSSHPPITHHTNRWRRLHWHHIHWRRLHWHHIHWRRLHWRRIHHHIWQIIPLKSAVRIFALLTVTSISILIPLFVALSAHRNDSPIYQMQPGEPTPQLTTLQTPGITHHSITSKTPGLIHHSITPIPAHPPITPKTLLPAYPPITPITPIPAHPPITPKTLLPAHPPITPKTLLPAHPPITPKTPQLIETGKLVPGSTINIRGSYFKPGGMVSFFVDDLSLMETPTTLMTTPHSIRSGVFAYLAFTQVNRSGIDPPTRVQNNGTFEKNFVIPMFWLPKSHHTILAYEGSIATPTLADLDLAIQTAAPYKIPPKTTPNPHPDVQKSCIQTSEATLSFSVSQGHGDPAAQSLLLSNCGKAGDWKAQVTEQEGDGWLHLDTTAGNLPSTGTQHLSVTTNTVDLQPGLYNGTIIFSMATKQLSVHVTLFVTPPNTCVQTTPDSLTFSGYEGNDLPPQLLTIQNCGDTGNWSVFVDTVDGANWLSVDTSQGSLQAGQSQHIAVRANFNKLPMLNGTFIGHVYVLLGISVNSQGNTIMAMSEVTVKVTISPPIITPTITPIITPIQPIIK